MIEHIITVGLFDKDTKKQEFQTATAHALIACEFVRAGLCATCIDCTGIYQHDDGTTVIEPSIRIECAGATREQVLPIIMAIKSALNQESVMYKAIDSAIYFF